MNVCDPRGHHFRPVRQFGQRHAFIQVRPASAWEESGPSAELSDFGDALMMSA
jgi:hypothetical protein